MRSFALTILVSAALVFGLVLTSPSSVTAAPGKNLKVYPKSTDSKVIKADMKKVAKALGVQCDYCHDMGDMAKDTKHKDVARDMMRMTGAINDQLKKGKYKQPVTCATCHAGQKKPAN